MATVTFIGDPAFVDGEGDPHNPATLKLFGYTFPLNQPVEVSKDDPAFLKLYQNGHFSVDTGGEDVDDIPKLRAELEALGGEVDKRWKEDRLKVEIAALVETNGNNE